MNLCGVGAPTLLINAGGESRRMGTAKALLPVPPRGISLIRHVAERLLPLVARLIVIANDAAVCAALADIEPPCQAQQKERRAVQLSVDCLPDDEPGCGPLGGLATGLRRVDGWTLTVAGDMPFLSPAVCEHLITLADREWDAVVPRIDGHPQPLHALYHQRCLPAVEQALAAGLRRMDSFWPHVRLRQIPAKALRPFDPDLRSFVNVNTVAEWEQALEWLSQACPSNDTIKAQ